MNWHSISTRTKLGVFALLLLVTAGVMKLLPDGSFSASESLFGACWRIGVVAAVFWLAYPDLARLPRWLFPAILVIGLAMIRWRWLFWAVPAVVLVSWLLRPRPPLKEQKSGRNTNLR